MFETVMVVIRADIILHSTWPMASTRTNIIVSDLADCSVTSIFISQHIDTFVT